MSLVQPVKSSGAEESTRVPRAAGPMSANDCGAAAVRAVTHGADEALRAAERESLLQLLELERAESRRLREALAQAEQETNLMQTALERRIQQRTAALTRANELLYDSVLEQRRTAAALQRAEELYRGFFENAIVGIYQSSPDGQFLAVNCALARMYGYANADELLGSVHDIASDLYVEPACRDEFRRLIAETGAVKGLEYQVRRRDGSVIWVSEHARAVFDRRQRLVRYEGVVRDITPRKSAEADRTSLETQLQHAQKMEAIGTLAGGIAHDFNNILGAITAHAELVADDLPADSPARDNLAQVLGASVRARGLVQQILTFSRRTTPERTPLPLAPLVHEVVQLIQAALPANITLRHGIETPHAQVVGNAGQLHQVLMNLCTNAAHAMRGAGGQLTVSLRDALPGTERPATLPPGEAVVLEVRDTGHGMPPEILRRVFEPFFTTKPVGEGTGLGLSVAHGIVKGHGGEITVQSVERTGTTFRVFLPCTRRPAAAGEDVTESAEAGGSERVLLVEDHEALRRATEMNLRRRGFRVRSCGDSRKALTVFAENPHDFDVLITDQTMPHLSGAELIRHVHACRPDLPVLLCTGDRHSLAAAVLPAQRCELLEKPLGIEALCAAIQRAVLPRSTARMPATG